MKFFEGTNFESALKTKCGTVAYMAPEVMGSRTYKGPPVDVFSCGVLLFMMHTAIEPFYEGGDKWHKLIQKDYVTALTKR